MKYAHIDTDNKLIGWYDSEVNSNIPENVIEVTEENWLNALNNNHNKVNPDGTTERFDFRTFDEVKTDKLTELKFSLNYEAPVPVNGANYIGGYDSAQKLDSKRRLVIESGGIEVNYIDADDNIVTLSLPDALTVCLAVANDYETKFYNYKTAKKAIEACTTIEELEAL